MIFVAFILRFENKEQKKNFFSKNATLALLLNSNSHHVKAFFAQRSSKKLADQHLTNNFNLFLSQWNSPKVKTYSSVYHFTKNEISLYFCFL